LPNNNERCYSNFSATFREVNTPYICRTFCWRLGADISWARVGSDGGLNSSRATEPQPPVGFSSFTICVSSQVILPRRGARQLSSLSVTRRVIPKTLAGTNFFGVCVNVAKLFLANCDVRPHQASVHHGARFGF
jgi:hypothetical protein